MAINIIQQPRTTCPVPITGDLRLKLSTGDHITQLGRRAAINIQLDNTVGVNDETFTILGIEFTVKTAGVAFGQFFFRYNEATAFQAAENLANMLRCNPEFVDAAIFVSGSNFVFILWPDFRVVPDWDNDVSGATDISFIPVVPLNGQAQINKEYFIYYRLFNEGNPVTELFSTKVPVSIVSPFGEVVIDFKFLIATLLRTTVPEFSLSSPFIDSSYFSRFNIIFGATEIVDCEPIEGKVFTTDEFTAVNALFELDDLDEFLPHCSTETVAEFISDRPDNVICDDCYEWLWVWISKDTYFNSNAEIPFYVEINQVGGATPAQTQLSIFNNDGFIYIIPSGTCNLKNMGIIDDDTTQYDITVWGAINAKPDYEVYSETKVYNVRTCHCEDIEIYFQSKKGNIETIKLKRQETEVLTVEGITTDTRIDIDRRLRIDEMFFNEGGRRNVLSNVDKTFTVMTPKIRYRQKEYRRFWEYFLSSPQHFIRTHNEQGDEIQRRIVLDMETTTIFEHGSVIQLIVTYQYTNKVEHF